MPPVVITNFTIFNRPVRIGAESVLKKAIPYVDSLTLSYADNVFSFEFAALSYANSHKNRYRYRLEGFDPGWNEVDSKHRLATYTNLDPGEYVFRVQGSNSDGVWNEEGVSLPILITPPWWRTNCFRAVCVGLFLALLWAAYQFRMRQVQHAFDMTLEARVGERTRIARELHDTLLQSFHGLLLRFQTVSYLLPERPAEAKEKLDGAIEQAAKAITEGRDAVQGLRASTRRTQRSRSRDQDPWRRACDRGQCSPAVRHSMSRSRATRARCTQLCVTRSTRLPRKRCGMPSGTRTPGGSRSRCATTTSNSACACVMTAGGSIRRPLQATRLRDTSACAA